MIPLAWLNAAPRAEFVARLGGVFEHSPWVAEHAFGRRPFATREALQLLMLSGWDTGAYTSASMEFDQLSFDASFFPLLRVSWMEVLISRHELMHWLWSNRDQREISVVGRTVATKHIAALQRLRNLAAQIPKAGC